MKRRHLLTLSSAALLRPGTATAAETGPPPTAIPGSEVGSRYVITGGLGEPLGKIVALKGIFVKGDPNSKGEDGRVYFAVREVAGRKLDPPARLPFIDETGSFPKTEAGKRGYTGSSHTLAAYESAGFRGIPESYGKYRPLGGGVAFHFETWLVILSTGAEKAAPK